MPHVIPLRMRADMAEPSAPAVAPAGETVPCAMREFLLYFLSLGTFGFGGPIALAGYMQRDLVERRRWISKQDYLEGLALAQLAPGPRARPRRDARRLRFRGAFAGDGPGHFRPVRQVRWAPLDARPLLRGRRRGDRDHRPQCRQAGEDDARAGLA